MESVHPEEKVTNPLSKLMVFWINPLISLATRRQLKEDDIWECPKDQNVNHDTKTFYDSWTWERQRALSEGRNPSLINSFIHAFGMVFLQSGISQFLFMISQIAMPYLVGELVSYVTTGNGGIGTGIGFALGLAAISFLSSVCISISFFIQRRVGTSIRSAIMMAVYSHALKLTAAARMQNTVGQTTNLMSIDAEKLYMASQFIHYIWHGPMANIVVMLLLIREVGVGPAMLGMAVSLSLLPTQNWIGKHVGATRRDMVKHTDERVKVTNEILQYIRVIKLYAWERPMEDRISNIRAKELDHLGAYLNYNSLLREVLFAVGPFSAVVIFASYVYAFGGTLTVVQIFRVIAFINTLRLPTNLLGQALKTYNDALVSVGRLNRFFLLPTLPEHEIKSAEGREIASITVANATFTWETTRKESGSGSAGANRKSRSGAGAGTGGVVGSAKRFMRAVSRSSKSPAKHDSARGNEDSQAGSTAGNNLPPITAASGAAVGSEKVLQSIDDEMNEAVLEPSSAIEEEDNVGDDNNSRSEGEPSNFSLRNLNIKSSRPDELIGIVGQVGCGKSSLMAALLGEMPMQQSPAAARETTAVSGTATGTAPAPTTLPVCELSGRVAYCAQTPWIQNLTLRDNVLFGADIRDPVVAAAYEEALDAAALRPDLAILPHGDMTEIGERGINLSGGQKARVSIARALLAASTGRAQVILMDDPWSAVDGATGNWIFERGVLGSLRGCLRVIALNSHHHLLSRFDRVIMLEDGRIVADGPPGELGFLRNALAISDSELIADELHTGVLDGGNASDIGIIPHALVDVNSSAKLVAGVNADDGSVDAEETKAETRSEQGPNPNDQPPGAGAEEVAPPPTDSRKTAGKLMVAESRAVGAVSTKVYLNYFAAGMYFVPRRQAHARLHERNHGSFIGSLCETVLGKCQRCDHTDHTNEPKHAVAYDDIYELAAIAKSKRNRTDSIATLQGFFISVLIVLIFSLAQLSRVSVDYILAKWAQYDGRESSQWSTIYFVSFGVLIALLVVRSTLLNTLSMRSCAKIHTMVFKSILCAPIPTFFDTHTVGEVLNRFSKDTETIDSNLPEFLLQLLINWAQVVSVFALCIWSSPWFTIALGPLSIGFYRLYIYFAAATRDLKRLESVSRSPIFASLSETLTGLETIRAYGETARFLQMHETRMERNQKFYWHLWMCMSWLTARMEIATSIILLVIAVLTVCLRASVSPISLGLALSYGLQLTALFQRCVQVSIDVSTYMTSTERVMEYLDIDPEESTTASKENSQKVAVFEDGEVRAGCSATEPVKKLTQPTLSLVMSTMSKPSLERRDFTSWPASGRLEFDGVWMQYRGNPSVLKGISFSTQPGERVGICGRTGAGKSSLMMALFRINPLSAGAIRLDGEDISLVPLQTLRSRLAIIPQDPVLFTGSVRFQLDPFQQYSDLDIWEALAQVNMAEFVRTLPGKLEERVYENGDNLSQGQRQLLCIARALLRNARVLVMDEGTSAVDPQTDELIQKALREVALKRGTTVLTIAHRLQTIIDFDKILVLSDGVVVECASPQELVANEDSVFSDMIRESKKH